MAITPTSTKSKQYQALGIDEIANDIETAFTEVNSLQEQIDNLPQGGGSGTTVEVNISSAQILAMGTTGVELLPAPAMNEYYDVEKIILEYTHVTTAYTLADPYINFGMSLPSIDSYILTGGIDQAFVINNSSSYSDAIEEVSHVGNSILGQSLGLYTWNGTNPTLGDGTLRAIITYTTRTFGA